MKRLSLAALDGYRGAAALPDYHRASVRAGIVHIGIGAFHRAHQAACIDRLLARDPRWGIVGASLRRGDTRAALAPQDGLYLLGVRGAQGLSARVIGAVLDVIDASTDSAGLIRRIADPRIRLVTLSVTEKGYCRSGAALDPDHAEVRADLAGRAPRSLPAVLCAALAARRAAGAGPLSVLSCDNLEQNGRVTQGVTMGYARLSDPALADWISASVRFPCSVVDRITPATTPGDRAEIAELTGLDDRWPVMTEPFSSWVIEDDFATDRPPFQVAGARMVGDVTQYEATKLRLLNGAHSTMAYLGALRGHRLVSDAVADAELGALLTRTARDEVFPTLGLPRDALERYWQELLARFANPAIAHELAQIAQDGSQKLPQRILAPLAETRAAQRPVAGLTGAVAAWMVWLRRMHREGHAVPDPRATELAALTDGSAQARVARLAALPGFLPPALCADTDWHAMLVAAIQALE